VEYFDLANSIPPTTKPPTIQATNHPTTSHQRKSQLERVGFLIRCHSVAAFQRQAMVWMEIQNDKKLGVLL
jgi:hypothetical protein